MGVQFDGKCFSDAAAASDAYFGSAPPTTATGGAVTLSQYEKTATGWVLSTYDASGSSLILRSSTAVSLPSLPPCDMAGTFLDGMAVGWLLAGMLISVSAFKLMRRAT